MNDSSGEPGRTPVKASASDREPSPAAADRADRADRAGPADRGARGETASAIYARIQQRRQQAMAPRPANAVPHAPVAAAVPAAVPVRIDEVLAPGRPSPDRAPAMPAPLPAAGVETGDGGFPRSATMRLALRHPAAALALGIPAALLLTRSPAVRRLVGSTLRLGLQPEVRQLVRLSVRALTISPAPPTGVSTARTDSARTDSFAGSVGSRGTNSRGTNSRGTGSRGTGSRGTNSHGID